MDGYFVEGTSRLRLRNGKFIPIILAEKGMEILGGGIIDCIVRTPFDSSTTFIEIPSHTRSPVLFPKSFRVSPFYPLFDEYDTCSWEYACNLQQGTIWIPPNDTSWMVSLILKDDGEDKALTHHMMVENYWCAVLGHECQHHEVLTNAYFGNKKVIDDIKKCNAKGFRKGLVTVEFYKNTNGVYEPRSV
jgi:hypothetical protein